MEKKEYLIEITYQARGNKELERITTDDLGLVNESVSTKSFTFDLGNC